MYKKLMYRGLYMFFLNIKSNFFSSEIKQLNIRYTCQGIDILRTVIYSAIAKVFAIFQNGGRKQGRASKYKTIKNVCKTDLLFSIFRKLTFGSYNSLDPTGN